MKCGFKKGEPTGGSGTLRNTSEPLTFPTPNLYLCSSMTEHSKGGLVCSGQLL